MFVKMYISFLYKFKGSPPQCLSRWLWWRGCLYFLVETWCIDLKLCLYKLDPFLSNLEKTPKIFVMLLNHKPKINIPTSTQICLQMHCGGDPLRKEEIYLNSNKKTVWSFDFWKKFQMRLQFLKLFPYKNIPVEINASWNKLVQRNASHTSFSRFIDVELN